MANDGGSESGTDEIQMNTECGNEAVNGVEQNERIEIQINIEGENEAMNGIEAGLEGLNGSDGGHEAVNEIYGGLDGVNGVQEDECINLDDPLLGKWDAIQIPWEVFDNTQEPPCDNTQTEETSNGNAKKQGLQAEKHLQIRQDAERRYLAMLEAACKILADQIIGDVVPDTEGENFQGLGIKTALNQPVYPSDPANIHTGPGSEEASPRINMQCNDGSTESCLTSHGSPAGLPLDSSSPGGKKRILSMDSAAASFVWREADTRTPGVHVVHMNSLGINKCNEQKLSN
nr:protein PHR1-LIKE 3-like isoform X1 [Ipomoea batatas]